MLLTEPGDDLARSIVDPSSTRITSFSWGVTSTAARARSTVAASL
jgi:hypothetical protein